MQRYGEIVHVLARHGLGFLLAELDSSALAPPWLRRSSRRPRPDPLPGHLRAALEELGATFVKIGQVLSTRADLVPPPYLRELERLRDHVPSVPTEVIRSVVAEELGHPLERVFSHFDDEPLASASIGQVHRAVLRDGRPVVVKVQKPGVAERVEGDLSLLGHLARAAAARGVLTAITDPVALVEEFAHTLRAELDYEREARNALAMAANFRGEPSMRVPAVCMDLTRRRVLVMEELRGLRIDDLDGLRAMGVDLRELARRSARILLRSIFEFGLYQADPHPGNFLVLSDGSLAALDFGMVGRVEAATREDLLQVVRSVVEHDTIGVLDGLHALGVAMPRPGLQPLRREFARLLDRFADIPLRELALAPLVGDLFGVARRFRLQLPPELAMLLKTLAMNEGLGRRLDPDFVATAQAAQYLREFAVRRLISPRHASQALRQAWDAAHAAMRLPQAMERTLRAIEHGDLSVNLNPGASRNAAKQFHAGINRLCLSVLAAGLTVALAFMLGHRGSDAAGWIRPVLQLGLAALALLGLFVLLDIRRSGR